MIKARIMTILSKMLEIKQITYENCIFVGFKYKQKHKIVKIVNSLTL